MFLIHDVSCIVSTTSQETGCLLFVSAFRLTFNTFNINMLHQILCVRYCLCVSMCIHVHREPKRDKRDWPVISLCKVQTCKQFVYLFELCLQLYILYFIFCVLICICVILCDSVFHCLVRSTYYQATLKSN